MLLYLRRWGTIFTTRCRYNCTHIFQYWCSGKFQKTDLMWDVVQRLYSIHFICWVARLVGEYCSYEALDDIWHKKLFLKIASKSPLHLDTLSFLTEFLILLATEHKQFSELLPKKWQNFWSQLLLWVCVKLKIFHVGLCSSCPIKRVNFKGGKDRSLGFV